jgi:hypothetical protein
MPTASGSNTSIPLKKHPNLACSSPGMCEGSARSASHRDRGTTEEPSTIVPDAACCHGKTLAGEDLPGALKALATIRMLLGAWRCPAAVGAIGMAGAEG